ncbi:hypothetical protein ACFU8I_41690, partial [Streptomyces sp. NPDC057540]
MSPTSPAVLGAVQRAASAEEARPGPVAGPALPAIPLVRRIAVLPDSTTAPPAAAAPAASAPRVRSAAPRPARESEAPGAAPRAVVRPRAVGRNLTVAARVPAVPGRRVSIVPDSAPTPPAVRPVQR